MKKIITIVALILISISIWANDLELINNNSFEGKRVSVYQDGEFMGNYFVPAGGSIYIDIGSASCYRYTYKISGRNGTNNFFSCTAQLW